MTTSLIQATPEQLKAKLDSLIAAGKTISQVIVCSSKSYYVIIHSV